jgi:hypothetical protein
MHDTLQVRQRQYQPHCFYAAYSERVDVMHYASAVVAAVATTAAIASLVTDNP